MTPHKVTVANYESYYNVTRLYVYSNNPDWPERSGS